MPRTPGAMPGALVAYLSILGIGVLATLAGPGAAGGAPAVGMILLVYGLAVFAPLAFMLRRGSQTARLVLVLTTLPLGLLLVLPSVRAYCDRVGQGARPRA